MSMTKKAGTALATGMSRIDGMVAQNGHKAAGGEIKTFKDEDGNVMSLYVDDPHDEVSFEGLLKSSAVEGKAIGDEFTACGVSGYITAWDVAWTNDDVTKVSGSLRDYTITPHSDSTPSGNNSTPSGNNSTPSGNS